MKPPTLLIGLVTLLAAVGCGAGPELANVTGTVLVDGELASRGTVTFYPSVAGAPATGRVREDGSFSLRVGQGNTSDVDASQIPPGEYRVTVIVYGPTPPTEVEGAPPGAGPRLMDPRYGSVDTTDLIKRVEPGENLITFDLEPAPPTPAEEPTDGDQQAVEGQPAATQLTETPAADQGGSP